MNNTKKMLQAMLNGQVTKETLAIKMLSEDKVDKGAIQKVMQESNLPSVQDLETVSPLTGALPPVNKEAILALMAGKDAKKIMAEGRAFEGSTTLPTNTNKTQFQVGSSTDSVNKDQLKEMVEEIVFDVFAKIMGQVNGKMKDKEEIKERLSEAVTFLKLKETIKKSL